MAAHSSILVSWPGEFHGLYGVAKSRTRLSDFHFHGLLDTHHIGSSLLKFLTLG